MTLAAVSETVTTSASLTQWVALGGAGALLLMLLRAMTSYQRSITTSAIERADALTDRVATLEKVLDDVRSDLREEQHRCDGLSREIDELRAAKEGLAGQLADVRRKLDG